MTDLWWPPTAAFLLALGLTYAVRPLARLVGAVATPKEDRWHRGTIPLMGGLAIAGAVLIVVPLLPAVGWRAWLLGGRRPCSRPWACSTTSGRSVRR